MVLDDMDKCIGKFITIITAMIAAMVIATPAVSQDYSSRFQNIEELFVAHAALDPVNGDVLIISNSWRDERLALRRFSPDGTPVTTFGLQRFETCCAILPSLVAIDSEGDIYTLEYTDYLNGFHMYKHSPDGELVIDWGVNRDAEVEDTRTEPVDPREDSYEEGVTTLGGNAGGGRLELNLRNPVDMISMDDGSVLILDQAERYVFRIAPDGRSYTEFIGSTGYIPERPQRLIRDSEGYLYLVDRYTEYDLEREEMYGVFKFTPEGEIIEGWGEFSGGINDPYRPPMDIRSISMDGLDNIIVLGGPSDEFVNLAHYEVFAFRIETGAQSWRDNVQYRLGADEDYLGMVGDPADGFIVFDRRNWSIMMSFYNVLGERKNYSEITDLYVAE